MIAMPVIAVHAAETFVDSDDDLARTDRRTPGEGGGLVPGGLAGYVYDGAAYCPECAAEVEAECADDGETYALDHFPPHTHDDRGFGVGVVSSTDEWDYPGATCIECGDVLDTNVRVYSDGGAHPDPVVRVSCPYPDTDPVVAFVTDDPEDSPEVSVILAEPADGLGCQGDHTTVPRECVVEGLDD